MTTNQLNCAGCAPSTGSAAGPFVVGTVSSERCVLAPDRLGSLKAIVDVVTSPSGQVTYNLFEVNPDGTKASPITAIQDYATDGVGSTKPIFVKCPEVVIVVPEDAVLPPVAIDAPTCVDGTTVPVDTAPGYAQRIVQEPGTALLVKLCEPQKDHEVTVACNAAGEKVMVQWDAGVVPPVELSRTNLFTGAVEPAGPLSACDTDQIEIKDLVACLNGVEITGFAVVTDAATPVVTGELWRDPVTGVFGPLPAGAVVGKCVERKLHMNPVHWSVAGTPAVTYSAFSFGSYPDLTADFPSTTSTADFYLHAIEHGPTQVWGTDGLPIVNPTTPVLWANAQSAVDAFLAAAGLAAGSIIVGNDGAGQPIIWFDTAVVSEGDVAWWAGPNTPDNYTNKLKAATAQNFAAPAAGTCVEGKAWYDESDGSLVRVNTLDGVDVTATVAAASLKEGPCPEVCELLAPVGLVSTWG